MNNLLKEAIEILASRFEFTLIDGEAGIEQINRKVMSSVDYLLLVSDSSLKGIRTAETIQMVAQKISGAIPTGLLLNRISSKAEAQQIQGRTGLKVLGWIPEVPVISKFYSPELSFFDLPPCPSVSSVILALEKIRRLLPEQK